MSVEENSSNSPISSEELGTGSGALEQEGPEVLGSHCCDTCIGDNLLKDIGIRQCCRCQNPFCVHFASKYDCLHYCVSCGSDIELQTSTITKEYRHEKYDESTDKTVTTVYSRRAKEYHLTGDTWMFMQRRIKDLSDAEADIAIEVHRQYQNLLGADQDRRRAEKAHRNANVKFAMPTGTALSSTTTVTETKKTTVIKADKAKERASAAFQVLLGQGMTMEDILKALGGIK